VNRECPALGAFGLFGFTASSFWNDSIGFNLWVTTRTTNRQTPPEFWFHLIGWGIPLVLTIVALGTNSFYPFPPPSGCWLNGVVPNLLLYSLPGIYLYFCMTCSLINTVLIYFIFNVYFMVTTIIRIFQVKAISSAPPLKSKGKILLSIQCSFVIFIVAELMQIVAFPTSTAYGVAGALISLCGFFNAAAISGFTAYQNCLRSPHTPNTTLNG